MSDEMTKLHGVTASQIPNVAAAAVSAAAAVAARSYSYKISRIMRQM